MYLCIYNGYRLMDSYSIGYNPLLSSFILMFKLSQFWLVILSCRFDIAHHFYSNPLLSCEIRCSRLILYFLCPNPEISHFSKQLYFLLMENGTKIGGQVCLLLLVYHCFLALSEKKRIDRQNSEFTYQNVIAPIPVQHHKLQYISALSSGYKYEQHT